jgi:hypothetical protein
MPADHRKVAACEDSPSALRGRLTEPVRDLSVPTKEVLVKTRLTVLIVLAAAISVASVAAAGPNVAKQRVAISARPSDSGPGTFVLTPLGSGALEQDSGTARVAISGGRTVTRQGQKISIYDITFTYTGKRGSLTIRERSEWVDVSNEHAAGVDYPPAVAVGTWKVVRGTGQYAKLAGGGRSAHAGMGRQWFARQEGLVIGS